MRCISEGVWVWWTTDGPLCGPFFFGQAPLSTTHSVLTGAVSRLKARPGRQLLQRTTRRVGPTDAGRLYLEQVRTAFCLLDDAKRVVQHHDGALAGRVHLSPPRMATTGCRPCWRALRSCTLKCRWN